MLHSPFTGIGSEGHVALQMGRKFIGIEREQKYFDIACRRIEQAYSQPNLFQEQEKKAIQDSLFN